MSRPKRTTGAAAGGAASPPRAAAYHHGDLRRALLEAARALLKEGGLEALSLREVARRAGVSPAAPYHHFADRAALVQALAKECLGDLDGASRAALGGHTDPRERLRAIGLAYVMYAVEHPAEFRLMFRPELGSSLEELEATTAPVFRVLVEVADELRAAGVVMGEREAVAISAWSLVHGLAALLVDGPLRPLAADLPRARALAERVLSGPVPGSTEVRGS